MSLNTATCIPAFIALSALGLGLAGSGCQSASPPATANGRALAPHTSVAGQGPITVVFESGLGDGESPWRAVIERTATRTRTFSYDRPGYGATPRQDGPRDPVSTAEALHRALQQTGVKPPYILVGHSIGGLYQYCFAKLYPEEVAGLVLLDPTHPRHWATMQRDVPMTARLLRGIRTTLFSATEKAEFDQQENRLGELDPRPLQGIPAVVLTRTEFQSVERGDFETMVHNLEQDWLRLLGQARLAPVAGAGHYLQKDQPAQVAQEINALVDAAERRMPRR